jgi:hypothetical protein
MTTSSNEQPFKETAPNPEAGIPIGHQIQVTSFGGSGTTMLQNWLVDNGASYRRTTIQVSGNIFLRHPLATSSKSLKVFGPST